MTTRAASRRRAGLALVAAAGAILALVLWWSDQEHSAGSPPVPASAPAIGGPVETATELAESIPAEGASQRSETASAGALGESRHFRLSGSVFAKGRDEPFEGAIVRARLTPPQSTVVEVAVAESSTDASGRYEFRFDPYGAIGSENGWFLYVTVEHELGRSVHDALMPAAFTRDPGSDAEWSATRDYHLRRVLRVRGRIVRASGGLGISGAAVAIIVLREGESPPNGLARAEADAQGRFVLELKSLAAGRTCALAQAAGFVPRWVDAPLDALRVTDVGDIALSEGACIEGYVSNPHGARIAASLVSAQPTTASGTPFSAGGGFLDWDGRAAMPRASTAPIDADGRFRLCGLSAGEHSLSLSYTSCAEGGANPHLRIEAPASGVRLVESAAIHRPRVWDRGTGVELESARFTAEGPRGVSCWISPRFNREIALHAGVDCPGRITADGYRALRFVFPALMPGEIRDHEVRLEPLPSPVKGYVRVRSGSGVPVDHVALVARRVPPVPEGEEPELRSDGQNPEGLHALPQLSSGDYAIEVYPDPANYWQGTLFLRATVHARVSPGMDPIEAVVDEGGVAQAEVHDAVSGQGLDARTSIVPSDGSEPMPVTWISLDGMRATFAGWIPRGVGARLLQPLPPGTHRLRFEADGHEPKEVSVAITAGGTTELSVVLQPLAPAPR